MKISRTGPGKGPISAQAGLQAGGKRPFSAVMLCLLPSFRRKPEPRFKGHKLDASFRWHDGGLEDD
jgi:hypothetical protein